MIAMLDGMPDWLGTIPQWGMFGALAAILIALIKLAPAWRQQTLDQKNKDTERDDTEQDRLREEIRVLREEFRECREECDAQTHALHEEIWGMRKQNIAEQISLINIILNTVDAPELKTLLHVLENVKSSLARAEVRRVSMVEHPIQDTHDDERQ